MQDRELKIGDVITCHNIEEAITKGKRLSEMGLDYTYETDAIRMEQKLTIIGKKDPVPAKEMNKIPDMQEMIEDCEKKKRPGESIIFGLGVGRMVPLPFDSRKIKKGIEEGLKYIKNLDGFLGVHPISIDKNILLFDTLNNAKGGKNMLKHKDVACGEIVPLLVPTEYATKRD